MKYRTTEREIRANYSNIIKVGYCELQHMLSIFDAESYTCSNEGWRADYYRFGNTVISTGYAPIGVATSYELCKRYDEEAEKILHDINITFEEQKKRMENLVKDFIGEALNTTDKD